MTLPTIVDIERVVSDYLRAHADIVALATRIRVTSPDDKTTSWVRIVNLDDAQVNQPDHLVEFMVQFDCYAGATGGVPEANTLKRTVRAVLGTLPGTSGVTGVKMLGGPRGLDTDLDPERHYATLVALIWAHA